MITLCKWSTRRARMLRCAVSLLAAGVMLATTDCVSSGIARIPHPAMSAPAGPLQLLYEKTHSGPEHWDPDKLCTDPVFPEDPALRSDITEISLERTGCYGFCSMYAVILRSDGTAEYRGYANVLRMGTHHGVLHTVRINELARLADDIGFFTQVSDFYACPVTGMPTVFVSASKGDKTKVIKHYTVENLTGPARLRWFED